jgi:hypothetical protein
MSRGLGKTQRLVLESVEAKQSKPIGYRYVTAYEIAHRRICAGTLEWDGDDFTGEWACEVCGGEREAGAADIEAVRRAIRTLGKAGRVEVAHYHHPTEIKWKNRWVYFSRGTARKMLMARLPLTAEEKAEEEEAMRRFRAALAAFTGRTGDVVATAEASTSTHPA